MRNKISVVVPVYNASATIKRCIESILNQSQKPYELVLVDDGSSDESLQVCKQFKSDEVIIRVIHQENGGATSARAKGVAESSGDWIMFVDSDDSIPLDTIKLFDAEISDEFDILIGEVYISTGPKIISNKEYRDGMIDGKLPTTPWAKLFRRVLFDNNTLNIPREIIFGEDMLMNIRLAFATNKPVKHIGAKVYEYVINDNSVSHSFRKTADYEEKFNQLRVASIPENYREEYFLPIMRNRINGWRGLNFLSFNVKENLNTTFYKHLIQDINASGYKLSLSERIQLLWHSRLGRVIAVGLNVLSVLNFRIHLVVGRLIK